MRAPINLAVKLEQPPRPTVAPSRTLAHDRIRWIASRTLVILGLMALASVLPTPLRELLEGLFGDSGVVGPLTVSTSIVFWSVGLVLTGRGLRHGHRLAWVLTLGFLCLTAVHHLVRHNDLGETVILGLGMAALVVSRNAFTVPVSRVAASKAFGLAAACMALGLTGRMLWHHSPGASRTIHGGGVGLTGPIGFDSGVLTDTLLALALAVLVIILWVVLSPRTVQQPPAAEHHVERERARLVVNAYGGGTLDYFALRDDKQWFFHGHSVVAYAVRFGVCLVSPDPVGPYEERDEVWAAFMAHARAQGWSVSVLGASSDWIDRYRSFGLHSIYLGDEAVVDCASFSLEGRAMKGVRQACNRVDRAGYTVSFHDPADLSEHERRELADLAGVSRSGAVERGFSMTLSRLFDDEDTGLLLSITRDADGRARAFIQWVPAAGIAGWSLDVMRYDTGADVPNGVMEHLIAKSIRHFAEQGNTSVALNFAVLRTVVMDEATSPRRWSTRLLHAVSGRSQIASLYRYNQKFQPEWRPRHVVFDSFDTIVCQGLTVAVAEGLSELPVIGPFMKGIDR